MNFDFNHGAKAQIQIDVSDVFSDVIDMGIVKREEAKAPRNYLGASVMGNECDRALQYAYFNVPKDRSFNGKAYRIFEFGHQIEEMAIEWFRCSGFKLLTRSPKTGRQYELSAIGGKFKGHADGIIVDGPEVTTYPALWECKSMNNKKWTACSSSGVRVSHPEYVAQVVLYQAYFNLTDNPAIFFSVNKDTCQLYVELIPFDAPLAQKLSDRAVHIIKACDAGELLPRAYNSPTFFRCKFCDWGPRCWGGA